MFDELVYRINGAFFTVFRELGNIWEEKDYEEALELELQANGFHVERQKEFEVFYFDQRVGHYRLDLLVEDNIVLELKAVPEVFSLHKAQVISYLKGYGKPLGILMNFGGAAPYYRIFPNKLTQTSALKDTFDYNKVKLFHKERIRDLLFMANRILITLGPGYFHQVYRRAFYCELRNSRAEFDVVKEVTTQFRQKTFTSEKVNFLRTGDLLLSAVAVQELTPVILSRFCHYIKHLHCQRGLIVNFHAMHLDFRYFELEELQEGR